MRSKGLIITGMLLLPFCMGASPDSPLSRPEPGGAEMPPRRVPGEYIVQLKKSGDDGKSFLESQLRGLPLKDVKLVSASSQYYKLKFDPDPGLDSVKEALSKSSRILSVEPNFLYQKF
ncbi:MAG: hypothetical protein CMF59_15905 [Leptospiraceae bacterium]|nr:hypothetical protein [Leptospiraceae bacterium]